MEIKTKYNIGDELWFINNTKAIKGHIHHIKIHIESKAEVKSGNKRDLIKTGKRILSSLTIGYHMATDSSGAYFVKPTPENELFITKEELIKSL